MELHRKGLDMLQVMLWQRKIELEREMNDVLDPSVGGDVVGAMKKEIHRMQLRAAELSRIQESLLLDMERSITKRDTIALKVTSHCLPCFFMVAVCYACCVCMICSEPVVHSSPWYTTALACFPLALATCPHVFLSATATV